MTEQPVDPAIEQPDPFDMDEWLDSVDGKELVLDAPDGFPNIPACYYLAPWSKVHTEFYCKECDRMRFPVYETMTDFHCPVCGRSPGLVEIGTSEKLDGVRPNDI